MDKMERIEELNKLIDKYNYETYVLNKQPFSEEDFNAYLEELDQLKKENPNLFSVSKSSFSDIPIWFFIVGAIKLVYNFPTITAKLGNFTFNIIGVSTTFIGYLSLILIPTLLLLITWQILMFIKDEKNRKYFKYLIYFDIVMLLINLLFALIVGGIIV